MIETWSSNDMVMFKKKMSWRVQLKESRKREAVYNGTSRARRLEICY